MKHNYQKLTIWKDALEYCIEVINQSKSMRNFSLKDQMTRSAISVPSNIAEGCERQTVKEFQRFLRIAAGSSGELRTQLQIAGRIHELDSAWTQEMINKYDTLSAQIFAFINKLQH